MSPPTDIIMGVRITHEFPIEGIFERCIDSLRTHTHNFRLVLVDDASSLEGASRIRDVAEQFHSSILIRTNFQHWFTRSFNLGLRMARTPQVVMLNCDTVLDTGWLEELYAVREEVMNSGQRVGIVGSDLSGEEPRRYFICQHPGYVTGHAWLVDMAAISEASCARGTPGIYLDETNPLMIHIRSDVEMCHRLMGLGWACVSSFKSLVGHQGGQTWGHRLGTIPSSLSEVSYRY